MSSLDLIRKILDSILGDTDALHDIVAYFGMLASFTSPYVRIKALPLRFFLLRL